MINETSTRLYSSFRKTSNSLHTDFILSCPLGMAVISISLRNDLVGEAETVRWVDRRSIKMLALQEWMIRDFGFVGECVRMMSIRDPSCFSSNILSSDFIISMIWDSASRYSRSCLCQCPTGLLHESDEIAVEGGTKFVPDGVLKDQALWTDKESP